MALDLRSIAFPDTQFRAAFVQPLGKSGINLCGQQGPSPARTRIAYIWANRIPNIRPPTIQVGDADFIPASQKTPVPVDAPEPAWKYVDRVRDWMLVNDQQRISVAVAKLGNPKALEIDLTKVPVPPGDYNLTGFWDWTPVQALGTIHVQALSDFKSAHLDPASQDRLLAKSGKVPVTITGSDFQFTTKVELKTVNDEFAVPQNVRFLLPKGLRKGPQNGMDVQIDTQDLDSGAYELLISQQDGKSHAVNFKILANPPRISNLPILINGGGSGQTGANAGPAPQHFVLKGERLDLLTKLEAPGVVLKLNPPAPNQLERNLTVELQSAPRPGTALPVKAYLQDRNEPMTLPDAMEITGPLPVIASSKLSLPTDMAIRVRSDEFPAGYTLNVMLDVKNIGRQSILRLICEGVGERAALRIGEKNAQHSLQQLSVDQLFLAFDTSAIPAGCFLQALLDNGRAGSSQPFTLAHILRVPRIDSFTVSANLPQNGMRRYQLVGENLEMIERLGWDDSHSTAVSDLPKPLSGPGLKQSIEIDLADPPTAESKLYVWLRGDQQGRAAAIQLPSLPAVTPSQAPAAGPSAPAQSTPGPIR